ncbi:transcriptional regulator GcvA [Brevundimonas sp.]|uniref:transcriptional regulator GcvA n=1 Tax=Brevundimonas sp. TaxID=1871086 RepID=UPI0025FA7A2B|nr:transcriptional regulator GcvA [Brevundimonas sp.]
MALPPFSALRALEAAARLRSYSRAADELFVTHGAVSHQIRALEQRYGVKLFRREGNEMVPTAAAARLARAVAEASDLLTSGVARLQAEGAPNTLVLSTLGGFFQRMLAPRLHRFTEANPDLEIDIRAEERLADFVTDGVDLALRYGPGEWPGVRADLLFRETVFPVCSPEFQRRHGLSEPQDLLRVPLLRHRGRPWKAWFQMAGVEAEEPRGGVVFDDSSALLDAAVSGLGAALARSGLAGYDLDSGRLIRPFPEARQEPWGYFIVWREDSPKQAVIQRFRDWLGAEFARERGA